jgi:hypothetical protein
VFRGDPTRQRGNRFGMGWRARLEFPSVTGCTGWQCGRSAVGSASPCQGEGRGFESRRPLGGQPRWSGREARQRPAKPCTRVQIPSPPRTRHKRVFRAIGAVGARFLDTEEVTGSNPVSPTTEQQVRGQFPEPGSWPQDFLSVICPPDQTPCSQHGQSRSKPNRHVAPPRQAPTLNTLRDSGMPQWILLGRSQQSKPLSPPREDRCAGAGMAPGRRGPRRGTRSRPTPSNRRRLGGEAGARRVPRPRQAWWPHCANSQRRRHDRRCGPTSLRPRTGTASTHRSPRPIPPIAHDPGRHGVWALGSISWFAVEPARFMTGHPS